MPGTLLVRNEGCDPSKAIVYLSTTIGTNEMSRTEVLAPGESRNVHVPDDLVVEEISGASVEAQKQEKTALRRKDDEIEDLKQQLENAQAALQVVPPGEEDLRKFGEAEDQAHRLQAAEGNNEKILGFLEEGFGEAAGTLTIANLETLQKKAGVAEEGSKKDRNDALKRAYAEGDADKRLELFAEANRLSRAQAEKKKG